MTYAFPFAPAEAGYAVQYPQNEVHRVELLGGFGRYRADQDGAASLVNVGWYLDEAEYATFMTDYTTNTHHGADTVEMNLVLDCPPSSPLLGSMGSYVLATYNVNFMPNSLVLDSKENDLYHVTAQLEVQPLDIDPTDDAATIAAFIPVSGDPLRLYLDGQIGDESYKWQRPTDEVLRDDEDGGQGRYRVNYLHGASVVPVSFVLYPTELIYFMALWRVSAYKGASPVTVPLRFNGGVSTDYAAHFIPGSLALQSLDGGTYSVTVNLEVLVGD